MKKLVTRSDFDGLVAGAILLDSGIIGDGMVTFVHPKDVQDGKIDLDADCITTNLPFDPRVGLAFDHHESELARLSAEEQKAIEEGRLYLESDARSAARVVYNYYKARGLAQNISEELVAAADKCDSADFCLQDILHPQDWVMLHYIMDARSGFGRFHDFRISNYDLMMRLMHFCIHHGIKEIMELPDVQERVEMYIEQDKLSTAQLSEITSVDGSIVIVDQRLPETIYVGNRFKIYAMFPEATYSVHVAWGKGKQNTALMVGKSIINKSGTADVGRICLEYGGGGHEKAGTCQVPNDKADEILAEIVQKLQNPEV